MAKYACPKCGYPLSGDETICPECGLPEPVNLQSIRNQAFAIPLNNSDNIVNVNMVSIKSLDLDLGNYLYECWIIGWKSALKCFNFTGRASRREYWSFAILITPFLIFIPIIGWIWWFFALLALQIRRMHDINKRGWWCLILFFNFFWFIKKSDSSTNRFGFPFPANKLLI